jgi:hypothetical protein
MAGKTLGNHAFPTCTSGKMHRLQDLFSKLLIYSQCNEKTCFKSYKKLLTQRADLDSYLPVAASE